MCGGAQRGVQKLVSRAQRGHGVGAEGHGREPIVTSK